MSVRDVDLPPDFASGLSFLDEESIYAWESDLAAALAGQRQVFTTYPQYFGLRLNEFRIVRSLLGDVFDISRLHGLALEIGCGFGFKSLLLSPYCRRLTAIDIPDRYEGYVHGDASTSIDLARQLGEHLGASRIQFEHAWPNDIALSDASVDFVYSEYVLEHVPDLPSVAAELARVCRPGATMVHIVPSTVDAFMELAKDNARVPVRQLGKAYLRRILRKERVPGRRLSATGLAVPGVHSEFARDFAHQLDVYSLENYLFPFIEHGFAVQRVAQSRATNHVLVLRRR